MTAPIVWHAVRPGRLRFQPSRSAPSRPHQVPQRARRERRYSRPSKSLTIQPPSLDPLENTIGASRPLPPVLAKVALPSGLPTLASTARARTRAPQETFVGQGRTV